MSDSNGVEKLDILIDQVGHLTEGLEEIKGLIREQLTVAQTQAESIKRQMAVSERLASTVERQSQLIETLIRQ